MTTQAYDPSAETDGRSHWRTLLTLLPYLWPQDLPQLRIRVVLAVAFLVLAKVASVSIPFFLGMVVDKLGGEMDAAIVLPVGLIAAYAVARILSQAFGELRDAAFAKVGQHALRSVALKTFRHLHGLSLRFHLERRTGGLSRVIERGTKGIDFLLRFTLFNILPTLLEIAMVCGIFLFRYNAWYALVTFVAVSGYIAFTLVVTEWRLKFRREMNKQDSEANTKAIDSLLNFETVKYFSNEGHESNRFDSAMERYERAAVRSQTSLAMLNVGQGGIIGGGLFIILIMAGTGVVNGTLSMGDFVAINAFMMQLFMPLNFLGFVYREIKQSLVDMEKMFELIAVNSEVEDKPGARPLAVNGGAVDFDHVWFQYESRRPILHDVNFSVPAGRTVAIVGPSGAGKSTISRILFRFYDVAEGSVKIDGQDIREVTQASVRDAIGIVPQDTVLFNDTIRYNIAYGRPEATMAEIEEAARLARIHDFIVSLPDGYDTMVGERGLKLSGGEKQRVAIARTILKQPRILLFDEATSALDSKTEKEIQASLREVSADRTTLVIAHRLSTIIDADEIIVLDEGRIVERGRHSELLAREGRYAEMWARQQQVAEIRERMEDMLEEDGETNPLTLEPAAQ